MHSLHMPDSKVLAAISYGMLVTRIWLDPAGSGGANLRAALRCLGADRAPRIVPPRKTKIVERQLPTATDPPPVASGGSTHLSV